MSENITNFIDYHNSHIMDTQLTATFETISDFALNKSIALTDISIEKHRLPFINWLTGLASNHT